MDYPHGGWALCFDLVIELIGICFLYESLRTVMPDQCWVKYFFILFLLTSTVQERLIRAPLVDTAATSAFRFSVLSDSKALIGLLMACAVITAFGAQLHRWRSRLTLSLCLGAFLAFVIAPPVNALYVRLLSHFNYLSHPGLYTFPYPWQLNFPAYLLFIEPTISCAVIYTIVRSQLSKKALLNLLQFALLLSAIRYALLGPFIYPFLTKQLAPWVAVSSKGQFLLEATVLGLTVGASCRIAGVHLSSGSSS